MVDYASQLNPQQHTANLVQRFSGQQQSSDSNWPVQLSLLTECDLVAVLALQYAHRGSDTVTPLDESQLGERVQNVAMYRQPEPIEGINRHQMVALWDALTISLARNSALDSLSGRRPLNSHRSWALTTAPDCSPCCGAKIVADGSVSRAPTANWRGLPHAC
ncbi:virulence factor SrfC family protein [Erwinia sp. MYb535]|uniref:virulence factor SrfC family protein n=1 Tax=Erwinia sp. MYb535 TaxID=2745309 RepID=UPI0030B692C4